MLERMVKQRILVQLLTFFLLISVGVGPLYAQVGRGRSLTRPVEGGSTGSSFRQEEISGNGSYQLDPGREPLNRERVLTQPPMSDLMYQVHILGEVKFPGTYRVMPSERLVEVLQRAGGVAEQGSERRIEIRRNNKVAKRVDIVKFTLQGLLDHNPYLLDNDVIFVPLRKETIQVVGAVRRPATYELFSEKNAFSVIKLAGGFSTGVAKDEPIRVIRFANGKKEVVEIDNNNQSLSGFEIRNGDVVYVPNVMTVGREFDYDIAKIPGDNVFFPSYEDRVFVLGGVEVPGAYPFNPYYNIHQYISLAGGFTQMSTKRMNILTPDGKKIKVRSKGPVKINPGDTVLVGERRIPPEGWVNLFMSLGSFGLSTTATVLTLTRD